MCKIKRIQSFFDSAFLRFIIVGCINTVVGSTIMFICYNLLHFGYWTSSALNCILASILSYFLNKHFTFQSKEKGSKSAFKFALNISCCYLAAYGIAKPFTRFVLRELETSLHQNIAMLVGMCLFTLINYLGQRFFVF